MPARQILNGIWEGESRGSGSYPAFITNPINNLFQSNQIPHQPPNLTTIPPHSPPHLLHSPNIPSRITSSKLSPDIPSSPVCHPHASPLSPLFRSRFSGLGDGL